MFTSALLANLEVRIPMQFGQIFRRNPTLAMKAIDVLAHNVLEMLPLGQFNHCHVSLGRVGFLDADF